MNYPVAMKPLCSQLVTLALLALPLNSSAATVSTGIDEQADLPYWQLEDAGMSLRLVQRMPDQSRAFFLARGFSAEQVEQVAGRCVFQTVFRNVSHGAQPSPLQYRQRDWRVRQQDQRAALMSRDDWAALWEQEGAPQAARLAFHWALLPAEQTYEAGDYNWGMTMIDLPPGAHFDLEVIWEQFGERRSALIEDLQCATDLPPPP